jgi:hypothetical protein
MSDRNQDLEEPTGPPKRAYAPPRLVDYGSVLKLTRGGGFLGSDGQSECNPPGDPTANAAVQCENVS